MLPTFRQQMDIRSFFGAAKTGTEIVPTDTKESFNPFTERKTINYPHLYKIIRGIQNEQTTYATLIQFDGAAEPNPGPACGAAVLFRTDNGSTWEAIWEGVVYNRHWTNNQAEYEGMILGLRAAKAKGIKQVLLEGDSALVICQTTKEWQCKDEKMKVKQAEVQELLKSFTFVGIRHVLRHLNQHADSLSKEGVLKGEAFAREV